ncbi:NADH-quinone oxidoreductase subunit E domain protein [Mycobacterium xenopi 4042]|uniref:NADH-quinone oxidoreductase subunit E domain protein n=1 Tax=Mycobacterium xenopi 4042 TaxID=1299334 RepID=X7Z304_MYCXE|nr:NADH-quinone oxidoreductase subunit E domain protein [Mycobacterium xenopi 4042]
MTGPQREPVFLHLGPPPEEPGQFVVEGAPQSYPPDVKARLEVDAKEIIAATPIGARRSCRCCTWCSPRTRI